MKNYKILSYYKLITLTEKYGFLKLRTRKIYHNIIITENDIDFSSIIPNKNFYIHSILRKVDNKILTVNDETDVYNGSIGYIERIGSFHLDGEFYMFRSNVLKSKSGIQAFFGGGTFVYITDFNKTPLKEVRKEKLKKLKDIYTL